MKYLYSVINNTCFYLYKYTYLYMYFIYINTQQCNYAKKYRCNIIISTFLPSECLNLLVKLLFEVFI